METETLLGPQSKSDNKFATQARLLQSSYRAKKGWAIGYGPNKTSKTKYGNMIHNGESNGFNFLLPETFAYAKSRIKNKTKVETIDEYRLFCNMLSSMPMCFNLFHPLMLLKDKNPTAINSIFRELFPLLKIAYIDHIKLEFIPEPITNYTNDKSAFDAFVQYTDTSDSKGIIAIETKYVEPLGQNIGSNNTLKETVAIKSGLFTNDGIKYIAGDCNQAYRNLLLTEAYRMVNLYDQSHSIILSPSENNSSLSEINHVKQNLKDVYKNKIAFYPLEDFVNTIREVIPETEYHWINEFQIRYLDL
ncbi:hypothetical protein E9993_22435 [Labilibacter sediminis]|nr:hypothetical protein E9993_22435 [Labilibacter sediminis]